MQACEVNIDFAQVTAFQVVFTRIPNVQFMVTAVPIPSIQGGAVAVPNPFRAYTVPGDHLRYDPLQLEFIVNGDFSNWLELVTWIKELNFPEDFDQSKAAYEQPEGPVGDCIVSLLNNQSNPLWRITFTDAYPIGLSGFTLQTGSPEPAEPITVTGTFEFSNMQFERV